MAESAINLLRALGAAGGPVRPGANTATPVNNTDFEALLSSAQAGTLESGLRVAVEPQAGVTLTDQQIDALSTAADRAEALGLSKVLVLTGGPALELDVASRRVTGVVRFDKQTPLTGFDGVFRINGKPEQTNPALGLPGGPLASGLLDALNRGDETNQKPAA